MFGRSYKKESGVIVLDGKPVLSTQQCVHCGNHEVIRPGSGTKRGFCTLCSGFLCGKEFCMKYCVPYEARIEYQEAKNSGNGGQLMKLTSRYPALKQLTF